MDFNKLMILPHESSAYKHIKLIDGLSHSYNSKLVVRTSFSGRYDQKDGLDADFKDCLFKNIRFKNTSLAYDDFRSVIFYNATFINCDFQHSDISQCSFYECSFIDCDFSETASFEVRYIGSQFNNCQFNRVVIRSARVHECIFDSIETTNRMFEDCIISRTTFRHVSFRLSTIIYNYGFTKLIMDNCEIIDDDSNKTLEIKDIKEVLSNTKYTQLEQFKLAYYTNNNLNNEHYGIEKILSAQAFAKEAVNIESLTFLSKNMTEFFFSLYDDDQLEVYYLLKLSYIFNLIIKHHPINEYPEAIEFQKLSWQIAFNLQSYLDFRDYIINEILSKSLSLEIVTHDNLDLEFVQSTFDRLAKLHGFEYKIVAQNSPHFIEIIGGVFSFVLLMLGALKKIKFERVAQNNLIEIKTNDATINIQKKIYTTKLGFIETNRTELDKKTDKYYQKNNSDSIDDLKKTIDLTTSLGKLFKTYTSE